MLFHVMWNMEENGTVGVASELERRLPRAWRTRLAREPRLRRGNRTVAPDALITIQAPDGTRAKLLVELKSRVEPLDVEGVLRQLRAYGAGVPLIVARFLSPRTRERIVELGGNYADATGNMRLVLDSPALFIEARGADRDPAPVPRSLGSLKGPAAGRVVRAVCDFKPPYGVRDLADRSKTSLGSVSRTLDLLRREALVEREDQGVVRGADWEKTIRRWTQDYGLVTSNTTSNWLAARGLPSVVDRLAETIPRSAVTGSFAAARLAPVTAQRLLVVFVQEASAAASKLDLRPAEAGANVLLVEPFDPVVFDRTIARDGLVLANPSQVAADLLTSPGRGPAEAEALLAWMKEHEDDWRS
jgi:hypothetical protein